MQTGNNTELKNVYESDGLRTEIFYSAVYNGQAMRIKVILTNTSDHNLYFPGSRVTDRSLFKIESGNISKILLQPASDGTSPDLIVYGFFDDTAIHVYWNFNDYFFQNHLRQWHDAFSSMLLPGQSIQREVSFPITATPVKNVLVDLNFIDRLDMLTVGQMLRHNYLVSVNDL